MRLSGLFLILIAILLGFVGVLVLAFPLAAIGAVLWALRPRSGGS